MYLVLPSLSSETLPRSCSQAPLIWGFLHCVLTVYTWRVLSPRHFICHLAALVFEYSTFKAVFHFIWCMGWTLLQIPTSSKVTPAGQQRIGTAQVRLAASITLHASTQVRAAWSGSGIRWFLHSTLAVEPQMTAVTGTEWTTRYLQVNRGGNYFYQFISG